MKSKLPYKYNKKYIVHKKGLIFSTATNSYIRSHKKNGDPVICISRGKNQTEGFGTILIRTIVAQHFIPNPENLPDTININHIRDDCRASNIRWVDRPTLLSHLKKKKRKPYKSKKRSQEARTIKSQQTRGENHYKFKGHYSKNGALYTTIDLAALATGESAFTIKRDIENNQNGWSFLPADESKPKVKSSTFIEEDNHAERLF